MSSTDEQKELEERFGSLLSINDHSLANLAFNIRREPNQPTLSQRPNASPA